jgi:tellurite resistance protein
MHIVIGFLSSLVALLWVLYRLEEMGISLGGLNPFYWRRRRAWRKKYEADPIYSLEDPMEVAAAVVIAIAKLDGDISASQKTAATREFANAFALDDKGALQLYGAVSHMLGQPQVIDKQISGLLERHRNLFTTEQIESVLAMMTAVASADGSLSDNQKTYLSEFRNRVSVPVKTAQGTWANRV